MHRLARIALALLILFAAAAPHAGAATAAGGTCSSPSHMGDSAAAKLLATDRPFAPTDKTHFLSYANPDWADQAPLQFAQGPALTARQTREALRHFLQLRFPCSPQRVLDGLANFDNPLVTQKIADPTLRAALAALTGTIAEPAIAFLLVQAPISAVYFGVVIHYGDGYPTSATATPYAMPDGTFQIVFDSRYRYNSFETFSALLFHEMLHVESPAANTDAGDKPGGVGLPEEATAISLETIVYMQMVLADPALASLPDPLTRGVNNHQALVRLNSGAAGTDRLNLFLPDSTQNLDPLAAMAITQFYDYYAATGGYDGTDETAWSTLETHGNALLKAVLPALAEPGQTAPANPDYDRTTLDFIDQNEAVLSPGDLLAVACALALNVPCG